MAEYKSLYINKTWNELTTSFDWVNCKPVKNWSYKENKGFGKNSEIE